MSFCTFPGRKPCIEAGFGLVTAAMGALSLLKSGACGPLTSTASTFHLRCLLCLTGFRLRLLGTFTLALRAVGDVLLAGTKYVVVVFFLYCLFVFKNMIAITT